MHVGLSRREPVNDVVQQQAVAHALQNMFKPSGYLNICCIKECAELCGIYIESKRLQLYTTQHCISWSDMIPEFRQTVIAGRLKIRTES